MKFIPLVTTDGTFDYNRKNIRASINLAQRILTSLKDGGGDKQTEIKRLERDITKWKQELKVGGYYVSDKDFKKLYGKPKTKGKV